MHLRRSKRNHNYILERNPDFLRIRICVCSNSIREFLFLFETKRKKNVMSSFNFLFFSPSSFYETACFNKTILITLREKINKIN